MALFFSSVVILIGFYSYPCPFDRHKFSFLSLLTTAPEISSPDFRPATTYQDAAPYFFTFHTSHSLWEVRKHGTVARYQASLGHLNSDFALKIRFSLLSLQLPDSNSIRHFPQQSRFANTPSLRNLSRILKDPETLSNEEYLRAGSPVPERSRLSTSAQYLSSN